MGNSNAKNVLNELAEAEARVIALKQQVATEHCSAVGHDWECVGSRNAGCNDRDCSCSVPVSVCRKCGDSDYGDTDEAREIVAACREETLARADENWFFDMDGKP